MFRHDSPLYRYAPYLVFLATFIIAFAAWRPLSENPDLPRIAAFAIVIFGVADWLLLAFLPRLGLSYGSIELAWLLMLCGRLVYLLVIVLPLNGLYQTHLATRNSDTTLGAIILWGIINLAALTVEYYSLYREPFNLHLTILPQPGPRFFPKRPLRLLQLADLHIERLTKRELAILAQVKRLKPDLIVLTGDYLNYDYATDPRAIREGRAFLAELKAPNGIFAIAGSRFVDRVETMTQLFEDLNITVLNDQAKLLKIGKGEIYLLGVKNLKTNPRDQAALDALAKDIPPETYSLLLYHTPDLIEAAAAHHIDLYLAGHTHGGQIRFPIIGAVLTLSAYGRKYASGKHTLGTTTIYTSRGLGLEGLNLPRARFLCPPELVMIELGSTKG